VPRHLVKDYFYGGVFGWDQHLNKWTLSKAGYLPQCRWASSNQLVFLEQRLDFPQQGILPTDSLHTWTVSLALPWVSSTPTYPADFGIASLHNGMSQFLKMNLFLYIDTFYPFCLSEGPWPMQWVSPGVGLVWGTQQKMDVFVTNLVDTWSFRLCTFVTLREQDYIFKWLKRKSWYALQSGNSGLNSTTATSWLCALEHISLNLISPGVRWILKMTLGSSGSVCTLNHVQLFATLWTVACQVPLSMAGKNTGVGCHILLQGICLTQGSNLCLLPCQTYSSPLRHMGSPGLSGGLSKPINVEYGWHKLSAKQRVVVMTKCLSFHQLPLAGTWVFLWFRQDYCSNKIHWQKNSFSWKRVFALLIFYPWCALEDKCTSVF